jgi:hypothetical protein
MLTNAERQRRYNKAKQAQGLKKFEAYLQPHIIAKIEAYKKHNNCTNAEAIEGLLL